VSVFRTGEGRWHELASWPPPSAPAVFRLHRSGTLTLSRNPAPQISPNPNLSGVPVSSPFLSGVADNTVSGSDNGETTLSDNSTADDVVSFRYDPADPTPSVGGRTLTGSMGVKDSRDLTARPDVRAFTTDPLPTAVDVIGSPLLELAISVDTPHADVFVRLCDVDEHGHARNFSDHMHRLDPAVPAGEVHRLTLTLDPCFHRLLAGHRLRLLITGGAFPRYARAVDDAGALQPSNRTLHCAASRLTLPVTAETA
jgi:putative CocE/NonD family hydrolase